MLVGTDNRSLWVNPSFFHLAHWAKYVPPGSIALTTSPIAGADAGGMLVAAFLRPDARVTVVVLADQLDGHGDPPANQQLNVSVALGGGERIEQQLEIVSGSITTVVLNQG